MPESASITETRKQLQETRDAMTQVMKHGQLTRFSDGMQLTRADLASLRLTENDLMNRLKSQLAAVAKLQRRGLNVSQFRPRDY